ncbi:hypothetical protein R3X27_04925 [Tropicimonas sp. TH_r6]|uniref:hypothetical protein n=1 Tax=Tropicimonas sp. TH_r6 TaxID=3082085 RepID=UPI002955D675|nr:hypothetical protein [Tropicimonas sp. TH_r6]MDV7142021.1 hypothetical protein [Tropicimonas sp. TH_r6]
MNRRSAAVVMAVTMQRIADGWSGGYSPDQALCIEALRRSSNSLHSASEAELREYLNSLTPDQLRGVVSNVKGIFHELLVERAEDFDGDNVSAALFDKTNHPGADLEFFVDGEVIGQVQLKAVQDPAALADHFEVYPDIEVMVTSEAFSQYQGSFSDLVFDSEFSNVDLAALTEETLGDLAGETLSGIVQDGAITSALVTGAIQARAILDGRRIDKRSLRSVLENMGVGIATAVAVEALINAV